MPSPPSRQTTHRTILALAVNTAACAAVMDAGHPYTGLALLAFGGIMAQWSRTRRTHP